MRRLQVAACAVVLFLTTSAGAIGLSLVPSGQSHGDGVELQLSETAAISVYLSLGGDDPNVSFVDIYFDATPLNDPASVGFDVVGRDFRMERNDGNLWFRAESAGDDRNIEAYALIVADDENGGGPGTNGPWEGDVDSIIIHGTAVGRYDLYFENQYTADGDPRPPLIRDSNGLAAELVWFRNGWRDDEENFDVPFVVNVVPEPASFVLLVGAGVLAIGRRRGRAG